MGHRVGRLVVELGLAMAVTVGLTAGHLGIVHADPTPPPNPSDGQIGQLATLINQVAASEDQLTQLDDDVAAKREEVNKALVDLQQARADVTKANQQVANTKQGLTDAGAEISRAQKGFDQYAAQTYTHGEGTGSLAALMGAESPDQVLDRSQLLTLVGKHQQAVLDGLQRARTEQANRDSLARAAQQAATAAVTAAEQRKDTVEHSIATAQAAMDQEATRKAQIESQRTVAQTQLDAARGSVTGVPDQHASFVSGETTRKLEQEAEDALLDAAKKAAIEAAKRVAADEASRDRARDMSEGHSPHTLVSPSDDGGARTETPTPRHHAAVPAPSGSTAVEEVIDRGMAQLGVSYAWGGGDENGPTRGIHDYGVADRYGDFRKVGFDCSGLMVYVFAGVGISLPHYSGYQYTAGTRVPLSQRKRGDMLFWGAHGKRHVALYLGDNQMLEAPESGEVVRVASVRMNGIQPYAVRMLDG